MGAVVEAYDVRSVVKEQVQSLGAKFLDLPLDAGASQDQGGYAKQLDEGFYRRQRELMLKAMAGNDVIITTAAVPGRRAPTLVTDIQGGYFDRLCMTPIRRTALLLGLMAADVVVIISLCLPVLAIGFAVGVRFATGVPGVVAFIALSALWGLAFTGLPYAVALKTGSPAAVNATFVVFFPLFFLSDAVVPKAALTGWFSTIATYNPVTYVLAALRSLITSGWHGGTLGEGLGAVAGIGLVSMALALGALRGRINGAT